MLHIKLRVIKHRAQYKQIFALLQHWVGPKVKTFSPESGHVYQMKGKEVMNNMQAKCLTLSTPLTFWVV